MQQVGTDNAGKVGVSSVVVIGRGKLHHAVFEVDTQIQVTLFEREVISQPIKLQVQGADTFRNNSMGVDLVVTAAKRAHGYALSVGREPQCHLAKLIGPCH